MNFNTVFEEMLSSVLEANQKVLEIYNSGYDIEIKSDNSPVTTADLTSNKILRSRLSVFEDIAWLSEEDVDDPSRLNKKYVFILDPLDGTQDFVNRDGSFAINLALVEDGKPIGSIISFPVFESYAYAIKGKGSYYVEKDGTKTRLHVSDRLDNLIYLSSKTHELESERQVVVRHQDKIAQVLHEGASRKAYFVASGKGDASVRYTNMTKEWDVCAPDLLVKEAGGIFLETNGNDFVYNRQDVYNRNGYCMFNRKENMFLLK